MANYILFDCPPVVEFINGLQQESHTQWYTKVADGRASVAKLKRILRYFFFPLGFILSHGKIEKVVTWQQFYGILLSTYARLLNRTFDITILTFIYKKKSGIAGRLFHCLVNFAISNPNVKHIVVFSPGEIERYSETFPGAANKFTFCRLSISAGRKTGNAVALTEPYIIAAGRSNRDYACLKRAAEATATRIFIACPEENADGFKFTTILHHCFEEDMESRIDGAFAVAVPLHDKAISSGQLSVLQAMRAAKPVIVTDNESLRPYIIEGKTAIVCHNHTEWCNAISLLRNNPELARKMGTAGYVYFNEICSLTGFGRTIGRLVKQ